MRKQKPSIQLTPPEKELRKRIAADPVLRRDFAHFLSEQGRGFRPEEFLILLTMAARSSPRHLAGWQKRERGGIAEWKKLFRALIPPRDPSDPPEILPGLFRSVFERWRGRSRK